MSIEALRAAVDRRIARMSEWIHVGAVVRNKTKTRFLVTKIEGNQITCVRLQPGSTTPTPLMAPHVTYVDLLWRAE
jgi:hypothetical protein